MLPKARNVVGTLQRQELLNNFENLENSVIGEGKHDELHTLLKEFRKRYLGETIRNLA